MGESEKVRRKCSVGQQEQKAKDRRRLEEQRRALASGRKGQERLPPGEGSGTKHQRWKEKYVSRSPWLGHKLCSQTRGQHARWVGGERVEPDQGVCIFLAQEFLHPFLYLCQCCGNSKVVDSHHCRESRWQPVTGAKV